MFPPSCNGKRVEDLQKEQSIQKTYYLKNVVLLGQNKIGTDKSSDRDKIVYSYKKKNHAWRSFRSSISDFELKLNLNLTECLSVCNRNVFVTITNTVHAVWSFRFRNAIHPNTSCGISLINGRVINLPDSGVKGYFEVYCS